MEMTKDEMRAKYQEMIDAFYIPKMQERLDGAWRTLHRLSKELDAVGKDSPLYQRVKESVEKEASELDGEIHAYSRFLKEWVGCSFMLQNLHMPDKRILSGVFPRFAVKAAEWVNRSTEVAPWID